MPVKFLTIRIIVKWFIFIFNIETFGKPQNSQKSIKLFTSKQSSYFDKNFDSESQENGIE